MRLRTRLTLAFAALALLPLLGVVPFAVMRLRASLERELQSRLDAAVSTTQTTVENIRTDARRAADELAWSTETEEVVRALQEGTPPSRLRDRASELMRSRGLDVLSLLDAKGRTLASGHLPARV